MKAVQLHAYGGVDQLFYEDVPEPKPADGEVLIKVAATSINPIDWKLRSGAVKGRMPLELPAILGRDVAGTVVSLGPGAQGFEVGDRVMGLVNHAYAEFLVANSEVLTKIPDGLGFEQAAALPLVVTTGAQLIEKGVQPNAGQTVLITGAAGNVGRTAVYAAKKHGVRVIAGVRTSQRKAAVALHADQVIALDDEKAIAALSQVDAIADTVGGEVIQRLLPHLRSNGVFATVVGTPPGADMKSFRVQPVFAQPDALQLHGLAQAVARGEFSIPVSKTMKLSEIREAQKIAEAGGVSKIVLIP